MGYRIADMQGYGIIDDLNGEVSREKAPGWSRKIGDKPVSPRAPAESYCHIVTILILTDGAGLPKQTTPKPPAAGNTTRPADRKYFNGKGNN